MRRHLTPLALLPLLLATACTGSSTAAAEEHEILSRISLPPGFSITLFAEVPGARSLALGPEGTLFVGSRSDPGEVTALRDTNGDGVADETWIVASGLRMPNGVALLDGDLYVAEVSRILRYDDIEANLDNPPEPVVVRDDYPTDGHHGWKYIAFGPDGLLYVPVGAPCNVCSEENPLYASITRIRPDGSDREIVAHGVRNTVGFDWHPETGKLWFTDNGRDWLGDNEPPDELNRLDRVGEHFGFPYRHGSDVVDPDFGDAMPEGLDWEEPVQELGPHVAALGMDFYEGSMFPAEYRGDIFIAEHGSWNRSEKIGYRVMRVELNEQHGAVSYTQFAFGWLQPGENVLGRPVDVLEMPDGSLLLSDDSAGLVYRIAYTEQRQ